MTQFKFPKPSVDPVLQKNEKRGKQPHIISTIPEYQRLGIDPDFMDPNTSRTALPTANAFAQKGRAVPRSAMPKQPTVNIGSQENHFWTTEGAVIDNNDEVDIESIQRVPQAAPVAKRIAKVVETPVEQPVDNDESDSEDFDIKPGQYMLLIRGKAIASGTKGQVEKIIEKIIAEQVVSATDRDYYESDDFVVLQRLNVKVGVLIG